MPTQKWLLLFCIAILVIQVSACTGSSSTSGVLQNSAPSVASTAPSTSETSVTLSTAITVTFSKNIDPATINSASFSLKEARTSVIISGSIILNGRTATFTPLNGLSADTTYIVTITSGIKDLVGNNLSNNYSWRFSTGPFNNSNLFSSFLLIPTGSKPEAVAIGDVTGDGKNDVVMTTSFFYNPTTDYKLIVFAQNALGGLNNAVTYTTSGSGGQYPSSVAIGDINNDGKNEVVIGNNGLNIEVFVQDGSGGLISSAIYTTVNSERIRIVDLNNDGRLDVVGVGYNTSTVDVFYQNSGGTLNPPVIYNVTHDGIEDLKVGDVNNDGLTDIIIMNGRSYPTQIAIMTQRSGTFEVPVYYNFGDVFPGGVAVGDVTGDGKQDVVVTYGGNFGRIDVFAQNSIGSLNTAITYSSYDIPEPVEIADINADGKSDVIVLHAGFNAMGVYIQNSDGTLKSEELYPIARASHYNPHGLAVGDINGDGLPDVVFASSDNVSGLVILYHK